MENTKFPIVIKKRNGVMIGVSILEIVMGIIFGFVGDGLKNILLWIFVFTGIVTALSVLVEYSRDIFMKENKLEFYNNKDLIKAIKYSSIKSINIDKGNEPKTKKKDFLTIYFGNNDSKDNRNKDSKVEKYFVSLHEYHLVVENRCSNLYQWPTITSIKFCLGYLKTRPRKMQSLKYDTM